MPEKKDRNVQEHDVTCDDFRQLVTRAPELLEVGALPVPDDNDDAMAVEIRAMLSLYLNVPIHTLVQSQLIGRDLTDEEFEFLTAFRPKLNLDLIQDGSEPEDDDSFKLHIFTGFQTWFDAAAAEYQMPAIVLTWLFFNVFRKEQPEWRHIRSKLCPEAQAAISQLWPSFKFHMYKGTWLFSWRSCGEVESYSAVGVAWDEEMPDDDAIPAVEYHTRRLARLYSGVPSPLLLQGVEESMFDDVEQFPDTPYDSSSSVSLFSCLRETGTLSYGDVYGEYDGSQFEFAHDIWWMLPALIHAPRGARVLIASAASGQLGVKLAELAPNLIFHWIVLPQVWVPLDEDHLVRPTNLLWIPSDLSVRHLHSANTGAYYYASIIDRVISLVNDQVETPFFGVDQTRCGPNILPYVYSPGMSRQLLVREMCPESAEAEVDVRALCKELERDTWSGPLTYEFRSQQKIATMIGDYAPNVYVRSLSGSPDRLTAARREVIFHAAGHLDVGNLSLCWIDAVAACLSPLGYSVGIVSEEAADRFRALAPGVYHADDQRLVGNGFIIHCQWFDWYVPDKASSSSLELCKSVRDYLPRLLPPSMSHAEYMPMSDFRNQLSKYYYDLHRISSEAAFPALVGDPVVTHDQFCRMSEIAGPQTVMMILVSAWRVEYLLLPFGVDYEEDCDYVPYDQVPGRLSRHAKQQEGMSLVDLANEYVLLRY